MAMEVVTERLEALKAIPFPERGLGLFSPTPSNNRNCPRLPKFDPTPNRPERSIFVHGCQLGNCCALVILCLAHVR
ncbi:hypothetical protein CGMCC3_g14860 [Colletotrichum fructicola]|nr:uncharacterized protein CGMCC3_g14860 [Colletotrichum fructicola]KAE9568997.1 hypothetical protein CGMCC3_g14860 [Colletotrichum fructicola]KAF5504508.1 hypothetical protein CGCF413_v004548 [Colletotrichum fructicola]